MLGIVFKNIVVDLKHDSMFDDEFSSSLFLFMFFNDFSFVAAQRAYDNLWLITNDTIALCSMLVLVDVVVTQSCFDLSRIEISMSMQLSIQFDDSKHVPCVTSTIYVFLFISVSFVLSNFFIKMHPLSGTNECAQH